MEHFQSESVGPRLTDNVDDPGLQLVPPVHLLLLLAIIPFKGSLHESGAGSADEVVCTRTH